MCVCVCVCARHGKMTATTATITTLELQNKRAATTLATKRKHCNTAGICAATDP